MYAALRPLFQYCHCCRRAQMHSQTTREVEITAIRFRVPLALTPNEINERLMVYGAVGSIKEKAIVLFKILLQWTKLVNH